MKAQMIPAGMIRSLTRPLEDRSKVVRRNGNGGYRLKSVGFTALIDLVKKGDQNAAGELIRRNLGLIILVIGPYLEYNEFQDLFIDAAEGLVKAARSFEEGKGSQFSSWAKKGMLDNIAPLVRNSNNLKGVGGHNFALLKKIWRVSFDYYLLTGEEPTHEQISEKLISDAMRGVSDLKEEQKIKNLYSPEKIKKLLIAWRDNKFRSLDEPISKESKRPKPLIDFCPSRYPSPETLAIGRVDSARYFRGIDPIDAQVIIWRLVEEMSYEEIGHRLGFSKQRALQRFRKGMGIIKKRSGAITA